MTGREAIEQYLKTHINFKPEQVATVYGLGRETIALAARRMVDDGSLAFIGYDNRCRVYSAAGAALPQLGKNEIFKECRESGAMQRILCVFGRITPADCFGVGKP